MDDMDMEDMKYTIGNKKVLSKDDVEEIHDQIEEDVDDDFPKISKIVRYRVKVTYEDDDGDEEKDIGELSELTMTKSSYSMYCNKKMSCKRTSFACSFLLRFCLLCFMILI